MNFKIETAAVVVAAVMLFSVNTLAAEFASGGQSPGGNSGNQSLTRGQCIRSLTCLYKRVTSVGEMPTIPLERAQMESCLNSSACSDDEIATAYANRRIAIKILLEGIPETNYHVGTCLLRENLYIVVRNKSAHHTSTPVDVIRPESAEKFACPKPENKDDVIAEYEEYKKVAPLDFFKTFAECAFYKGDPGRNCHKTFYGDSVASDPWAKCAAYYGNADNCRSTGGGPGSIRP